jgi:prolyl-tRNA synthetase
MDKNSDRITPRTEDYSQWYLDVVRHANLAEQAEVVKGCMVIKPNGYAIWEKMQRDLDDRFKATDHVNAYFPMLIPQSFLQKEAEHVEGFAPEVAMVTHAGGKELEEPYAIRPTSETIIGYFFSKWIESHRDLPLLINQWANVMRWEMRTRLFLRTGEFLWQEGHTAHSNHVEAQEEVQRMLDVYADFAEEVMAMPVIKGQKTENEKFAGALSTYSIEAMMQDGRALQAGTSHDLGQNFGKAFDVKFQNKDGELEYVWQTSWGVSTRLIGGLIMTHSDDAGLVLPPKLASLQVVIVPVFRKENEKERVITAAQTLADEIRKTGHSVKVDDRDWLRPGAKYYEWERQGVCYRVEIGPRDLDKDQVVIKGRIADGKEFIPRENAADAIHEKLEAMQIELFERAKKRREENSVHLSTWDEFLKVLITVVQNDVEMIFRMLKS